MAFQHLVAAMALLFLGALPAGAEPATAPAPPAAPSPTPAQPQEIVVCGQPEDSRYRLPTPDGFDPRGLVDSVSRERNRLLDVGASGIHSCSAVGPGGWTGCDLRRWRQAHEQRAGISQEQPNAVSFGPVAIGVIKR